MTQVVPVDHDRWPDLAAAPSGPRARVSATVARRLFTAATQRWGVPVRYGPQAEPHPGVGIDVVRPEEFFARLGSEGLIGFGEAYLTGAWDSDHLAETLTVLAGQMPRLVPPWMQRLRGAWLRRPPRTTAGTPEQSRSNIAHHYDLSNDFFAIFLDPTMTYSSAIFEAAASPEGSRHRGLADPEPGGDLQQAQVRKLERLLDRTGVGQGSRVLEIGTGWGELAIRAAARGASVHSITLSAEQLRLARQRVAQAGLEDRVHIELRDYRALDPHRRYDAVVSAEMIEAVGYDFWPQYFATIDRVLERGGVAGIQAIVMPHDRMMASRNTWTFIGKYIFPGGLIPSVEAIEQVAADHTGLRVAERLSFGAHYAETLRQWEQTFLTRADEWRALGFDETFGRMWRFYLAYSRAGFASRYLDVQQILMRPAAR